MPEVTVRVPLLALMVAMAGSLLVKTAGPRGLRVMGTVALTLDQLWTTA